jgi:hypothetical protein
VKVVLLYDLLCTPRVSKENVVQAVGWVNIRGVVKTPVSCGTGGLQGLGGSICVRSMCCDERLERRGDRAVMKGLDLGLDDGR